MLLNSQSIQCPTCNTSISIDEALSKGIEAEIRSKLEKDHQAKALELSKKEDAIQKQLNTLEANQKAMDDLIAKSVADQVSIEKLKLFQEAKAAVEKEQHEKTTFLEEQLKEKEEKLRLSRENEIAMAKAKSKLEEDKRAFELEKIKQLDQERVLIREEANKKAAEEQQYKLAQLEKKLSDATKVNNELSRKLEQGSQQTQGEVLELVLEELLKNTFLFDEIQPVPKGITGVDMIQQVKGRNGQNYGVIAWESKQTQRWQENWIQKLKDDQRAIKADIAVIVSAALPPDIKGFGFRDGVWICDIKLVEQLAVVLRTTLEAVAREKAMSKGKDEKVEALYAYITGTSFKQRVEALMEAYIQMEEDLRKEQRAYQRHWSTREQLIKKLLNNTIGMYGDLNGLVPLPQIQAIELDEPEKVSEYTEHTIEA